MGYTRGRLWKNGQGTDVRIIFEMKSPRIGIGQDVVTPSFVDTRRVLFVAGGVQIEVLKEQPVIVCDEQIDELIVSDKPKIENVAVNDIVNMQGCFPLVGEP